MSYSVINCLSLLLQSYHCSSFLSIIITISLYHPLFFAIFLILLTVSMLSSITTDYPTSSNVIYYSQLILIVMYQLVFVLNIYSCFFFYFVTLSASSKQNHKIKTQSSDLSSSITTTYYNIDFNIYDRGLVYIIMIWRNIIIVNIQGTVDRSLAASMYIIISSISTLLICMTIK